MKLTVIHIEQRVQNAPLDRFATVAHIGNGAIYDHVAGVLEKIALHQRFEMIHPYTAISSIRLSIMKALRSGVFFPMKNSSALATSPMLRTVTGTSRMSSAMN